MAHHKENTKEKPAVEAVTEADIEITEELTMESVEAAIPIFDPVVQKEFLVQEIIPPRISDKVVFTDNYPQGYGKKLCSFIMDVDKDWKADLATFDKTQNPIVHPRMGIPYDQSGTPGTWAFILEQ